MLTKYVCTNPECRAEDSDHTLHPPLALICYRCRNGSQVKTIPEMIQYQLGMFPVKEKVN